MALEDRVVLLLGAGASLPAPSNGPLFGEVRDSCAARAGVQTARWRDEDPRRKLLEHVIPEVFLKALLEAGYDLSGPLARAVTGPPGAHSPNAVHHLAARVVAAGGVVWTTNWDRWIEIACGDAGVPTVPAVYGADPSPKDAHLRKLHGSSDRPDTLRFASSDVIRPLDPEWHRQLVESCRDRKLLVVGYGGADIDLYTALDEAIEAARVAYWFEGTKFSSAFGENALAQYEAWRFRLSGPVDPSELPDEGRWLVWCGPGSSWESPAKALLDLFHDFADVSHVRTRAERLAQVDAEVSKSSRSRLSRAENLFLSAAINERLASRRTAAMRHILVILVGPIPLKRKSFRSLGNLSLLRSHPWRRSLNRAYQAAFGRTGRARFYELHAGGVDYDQGEAATAIDRPNDVDVDDALNISMAARWNGDLTASESIARSQLRRALAMDLSSKTRDWPERIARSAYELAQSLVWQGRFYDADDVCRSAYMRVAGAKWAAWEYSIRGVVHFSEGGYLTSHKHLATAIDLLDLEGFGDFTATLHAARASCSRMLGRVDDAAGHLESARSVSNLGAGSMAAILLEAAELHSAGGEHSDAADLWRQVAEHSPLPLWQAIANLRLAENMTMESKRAEAALSVFEQVQSQWGIIRSTAFIYQRDVDWISSQVARLGRTDVFIPGRGWLL